jgi:Rieske Fe-S protein
MTSAAVPDLANSAKELTMSSSPDPTSTPSGLARRPVLQGAAVVLGVSAVSACQGYGRPTAAAPPAAIPSSTATGATSGAAASGGSALAKVADIPVGGGTILADSRLVVTQPASGDIHVLSAVCTHQGCIVGSVTGGQIQCPCHGSAYSLTGEVANGPATRPLAAQPFKVVDGVVTV